MMIHKWQSLDLGNRLLIYIAFVVTVAFIVARIEGVT